MVTPPPRVVGVCTLTTRELAARLCDAPGVAVAAPLMTANLGIEELVRSVLNNPHITVLLLCGRDSPLFMQGQTLAALIRHGIHRADRRIIGAAGHHPFLPSLDQSEIDTFRSRVRLVDLRGVLDPPRLRAEIAAHARRSHPAPRRPHLPRPTPPPVAALHPGGRRRPIATAGEGFFVVAVDARAREVVLRHYDDNLAAAHEMRGRRAESMVLGVLRAGLVHDPAHAAYLGAELVKAETAVRLGLDYAQDLPLRHSSTGGDTPMQSPSPAPSQSLDEFLAHLAKLLDAAPTLAPHTPIGDQVAVDSSRMIELAIALEQECGIDLPDDIDLRATTPADLYSPPEEAPS
ncbi:MAG TPA: phosphopantetheine-binding protein [Actinophytocola sp.]|uniref:DUF4346 domain-containing protein n=1 Tax=Actinophytocola sp. TaxID=1872138 RepID=UPI002DB9A8BE|nr:phosphopantetheine-binding protein [Actinophytocola sp.]HEU5469385.1 phosphopantetheine-binding protein [Actinophytocola sp.]